MSQQPTTPEAARIERQLAELIAEQARYLLSELARLDKLRRGNPNDTK